MTTKAKKKHYKNILSIRTKVALLCTVFILISTTVNYTLLLRVSKATITDNLAATMQDLAMAYSKNVSDVIDSLSESANFLMQSDALLTFINSEGTEGKDEIESFITMYLNMNSNNEEVSLVNEKGIVLYSSSNTNLGKDLSSEEYFKNTMTENVTSQSDVFISESSGDACIRLAVPIRTMSHEFPNGQAPGGATESTLNSDGSQNDEQKTISKEMGQDADTAMEDTTFTGAITVTVKVSQLQDILANMTLSGNDSGYAYLLDSKGTVVYHPEESLVGTNLGVAEIDTIVNDIAEGTLLQSDIISYTFQGEKQYAGFSVNENNKWILVITANESEILSSLNDLTTKSLGLSVLLTLILTVFAYIFTKTITDPIKKLTAYINKTAALDFTPDAAMNHLTKRKDETGEMSRALDSMRSTIKSMLLQIGDASQQISRSADDLSQITQSVNNHAADNSGIAQELSASMEETAATTEYICGNLENIGRHSREMNEKASSGSNLSQELMKRASVLKISTNTATENTQKIYHEVKEKTTSAIEQAKAVEKINNLTNVIKEIATQTSLLALNASIEAARAGDAGRGFSVVAGEIGSLAEQSSRTVSGINDIIHEVYEAVTSLTDCLEQSLQFLERNVLKDYTSFVEASDLYNADANSINQVLDSIHEGIGSLNADLKHINTSVSEINTMVGDASLGVNDVAEKNAGIVSFTVNTHNMVVDNKNYAMKLQEIVEKFKM